MITLLSNLSQLPTSTAFWVSFVLLVGAYFLLAAHYTTVKQRSWLLTTLSSALMSLFSLPLLVQLAYAKGQLELVSSPLTLTDSIGRFFQAYLIADLACGMLFYRSKVNILTGWIHHTVYVFIVEYAIQSRWSHIFVLCAVMEIPTFILAMGSIVPRLRSDAIFALSFFSTRIVFHVAICSTLAVRRQQVTNGSFGPAILMACILPLHIYWFTGCVKGLIQRAKMTGKSTPTTKLPVNAASSSPERPITPTISSPVSLYASRMTLARRRTTLRMAMRARWDQLKLWKASGRLSDMQRRVRAALPGRERVYQYVGLERYNVASPTSEQGLEFFPEDGSSSIS